MKKMLSVCVWALALQICAGLAKNETSVADAPSEKRNAETVELVRKAAANYLGRKQQSAEYAYVERIGWQAPSPGISDTYEMIAMGMRPYRRHTLHNDAPLSADEERREQERFEAARRLQDEWVNAGKGEVIASAIFHFDPEIELNFEHLADGFDIHLSNTEEREGRQICVVEAKPKAKPRESGMLTEVDALNFQLKIWIDIAEAQIIRVSGKAIRPFTVVRMESVRAKAGDSAGQADAAALEASLRKGGVRFDRDLVFEEEWKKANGESWLPSSVSINGHLYVGVYVSGEKESTDMGRMHVEFERVYSDYKKFRVEHRIVAPPD